MKTESFSCDFCRKSELGDDGMMPKGWAHVRWDTRSEGFDLDVCDACAYKFPVSTRMDVERMVRR